MKLKIDRKNDFIRSWSIAERSAASSGPSNIFSTVRMKAGEDGVELMATDMKTSIICKADGVTVLEPGEAVIPIKGVSDLFRKAGSDEFSLDISGGRARMTAGKSRYKFSTYNESEFPKLPSSDSSETKTFCTATVSSLEKAIERGALCASVSDEFPQYLSCALFERVDGEDRVVSTDKRRLAVAKFDVLNTPNEDPESLLLPLKALRELIRVFSMHGQEDEIAVLYDDSQVYFRSDIMEFAIRRVESKFPPYASIIPTSFITEASMDRASFAEALDRVDVVVRDFNKVAVISVSQRGEATVSGRSPDFGEAVERIQCVMTGDSVLVGMNTRYLIDTVKAIGNDAAMISLRFTSKDGHVMISGKDADDFFCLVGQMDVSNEQLPETDEEIDGDLTADEAEGSTVE